MTSGRTPLPPEYAAFAALIDARPATIRQVFHYLLYLAMAERGALRLVDTHPGASGEVAVFDSAVLETFTILRPPIAPDVEARVRAALRAILDEDAHSEHPGTPRGPANVS